MKTTEELIVASQKGDMSSFEELLILYQDRVYTHCLHLTGNAQDAQDLAQDVFIQAFRKINSFRGDADFGTWLHRIAVNLWINQFRKNNKLSVVSYDEPVSTGDGEMTRELITTEDSPQELVEASERAFIVQSALAKLPEEFKVVIVLRDLEGYRYEEIAEMVSCSLGTVKSRINRGRKLLRKLLLEENIQSIL
jgi:RNA polymerase sigma-70 factor (ECF subfamily)